MILADCKTFSEWTIDDEGNPFQLSYNFEGVDVISYKIVPTGDTSSDSVFESENYEVVKAKLLELNK